MSEFQFDTINILHVSYLLLMICLSSLPNHHLLCRRPDTKVIIGMRNIKDAFVSLYHHYNMMDDREVKRPWEEYFNYLLHSKSGGSLHTFFHCINNLL